MVQGKSNKNRPDMTSRVGTVGAFRGLRAVLTRFASEKSERAVAERISL